jgi:hypothetical protein
MSNRAKHLLRNRAAANGGDVQRLAVSDLATIYGCCGLFDLCGEDDLISLSMQGADAFMDWIGWEATDVCVIEKNFISWVRPTEDTRAGWLSDPCADPNSVEFGTCAFRINDFARLRRAAPVQDITKNHLRLCERQPRYRLDGTRVNNDYEFRALLAAEAITQDLKVMTVTGNVSTGGQFSGLENLVKTGYTDFTGKRCALMDSIVVDWNDNTLDGGSGVTWTDGRGTRNIASTYNFIDVLLSAFRTVIQRIKMSATLAAQNLMVGDVVLLTTTQMAQCILDFYTCWRVCPGEQYNEANLNSLEAREYRNSLMGGMFNGGRIYLDGFEIPIIAYDWGLQKGPTRSDVYLLVGSVGNIKTMSGQYNNMSLVNIPELADVYGSSDGGRFLHWENIDQTCVQQVLEFQPRLLSWTPWANVRFQDVRCNTAGGFLSPDPMETSFFPETSFTVAAC